VKQEDRERLIRIDERTEVMEKRLNDYSGRIRALERFRTLITGAGIVLVFLVYLARDLAVEYLKDLLHRA
jgi:hypothetical protein